LLVKDERAIDECPDDSPWKAPLEEAVSLAGRGRWAETAERLGRLADQAGDVPVLWRNLALIRTWIGDRTGAIDALEKLAGLDVPVEDAVESLALARLLSDDPLGDLSDVVNLAFRVGDADHVQAVLSSSPRMEAFGGDLSPLAEEGQPPPKGVYWILDRDKLRSPEELSPETVPRVICQAMLFGRQTDRDARLNLFHVHGAHVAELKALIAGLGGDEVDPDVEEQVIDQESATEELLGWNWSLPPGTEQELVRELAKRKVDQTLLETWPASPSGLLDGKSPQEAAGEAQYHLKVLAAILVLEAIVERSGFRFEFNRLRSRLGLPTLAPIDPQQAPVAGLPLVRLARVEVEKLDRESLLACFGRATFFNAHTAAENFAREIANRPGLESTQEYLGALTILPQLVEDSDEAMEYTARGKKAALARGRSCAPWDLMELRQCFRRFDAAEASRVLEHIQRAHLREPGVPERVTQMLMEAGVIGTDGSPRQPPEPDQAEQPAIVVPGQESAETGKIWTPGAEEPGGQKSKLWTPDSG
jgi:hypothetical protein